MIDIEQLRQLAREAEGVADWHTASKIYHYITRSDHANFWDRHNSARAILYAGQLELAEPLVEALNAEPGADRATVQLLCASLAEQKGDPHTAEAWAKARELGASAYWTLFGEARAKARTSHILEARELMSQALLNPDVEETGIRFAVSLDVNSTKREAVKDPSFFTHEIIGADANDLETELARHLAGEEGVDEKESWALKFLREYDESGRLSRSALERAIRCCHKPTDLQAILFGIFRNHFRRENHTSILHFSELVGDAELLVLHMTCRSRIHLAFASGETFAESRGGVRNLIVIGRGDADSSKPYEMDLNRGVLTVPAPDTYEGLARKMAAAYRFLGFGGFKHCVLKVDDDIRCSSDIFDAHKIIDLAKSHDYVGQAIDTRMVGFFRWWHLGKCEDAGLNRSPYSMVAHAHYANGPAYVLGPRSVGVLARSSVYYCQQFEIEGGYEDLAVGKILNSFGIYPFHCDPILNGALFSVDS